MKKRYRITYVGEDGADHDCIVWANGRHEAVARVKRGGVDIVVAVRKTRIPYVVAAILLAAVVLTVLRLCR